MRGRRAHRAPGRPRRSTRPVRQGASRHGTRGIDVGGPAARVALRGRLGRRALRPPAPRAVRRRPRRRPTRPPSPRWWPGTGRWCWASAGSSWATTTMPRTPSRPSSSCWPGRPGRSATPTCWATGSTAWRSARPARPAAGSPAAAGPRRTGAVEPAGGASRRRRPSRSIDREQAEALHARDRPPAAAPSACRSCSATSRASRLDEAARRLRWPGRHAPQPAGPGPREAPPRAGPPRRRALGDRAGRGAGAPIGLGVRLIPPVRFHDPGRDRASRPVTPPAGRSPPPPRPWPRRSCVPC